MVQYDKRHGGAYDRGSADAYYRRPYRPHMFEGATSFSKEILKDDMSEDDLDAYDAGYEDQMASGEFKDYR